LEPPTTNTSVSATTSTTTATSQPTSASSIIAGSSVPYRRHSTEAPSTTFPDYSSCSEWQTSLICLRANSKSGGHHGLCNNNNNNNNNNYYYIMYFIIPQWGNYMNP
jgi:hypothetical protein